MALLSSSLARAADYYVDPASGNINNPGSSSQPWNTLQDVVANKTFAAGDVIYLRSGYHGIPAVSGNNSAEVAIRAEYGHTPTVRRISFNNASRWTVSGLDISPLNNGGGFSSTTLVDVSDTCSFISVRDSRLYFATNVSGWSTAEVSSRLGLAMSTEGADCTFANNRISYVKWGIRLHKTAERSAARYNLIEEIMGDGIRFNANDLRIEYNTIVNFMGIDDNHDDGIQGWTSGPGDVAGTGTITGVEIRGNYISNNTVGAGRPFPDTYGVQGIGLFDGMFENCVIENNVIAIDMWHGIAIYGATNCRIVNNTVAKNPYDADNKKPWITIRHHKDDPAKLSSGNLIYNNYSWIAPGSDYVVQGSSQSGNIFSSNPAEHFVDYAAYNFHLISGSSAIDNGTSSNAPGQDRDGLGRSGNPDTGAYEYTAWPATAARLRLDETSGVSAADSTPKGNVGRLHNGPVWSSGQFDGALAFDGGDDVVTVSRSPVIDNMPALTVSAWIRPASLGGGGKGRIVAKADGTGPVAGWHLHLTDTNQLQFRADYSTTDLDRVSSTNAVALNIWKHVVMTWDGTAVGTSVKFYVNGVETGYASTTNGSGTRVDDRSSALLIGNNSTLARGFDGDIDDVRIYEGVLTSGQVTTLFQAGPPLAPWGLTATKFNYGRIDLSWTDNAANETGFRVERKKGASGTYEEIATVSAVGGTGGAGLYSDTTTGSDTTYYYRVRAYNSYGDSPASAAANATTDEVSSGRVGHWKFDESAGTSAADSSGNANTGTLGASPANPAWIAGKIGNALNFDLNDSLSAGSGSSLDNLAALTVAVWIHADSLGAGSNGRIVSKAVGTGPASGWQLQLTGSNQLLFRTDYSTTDLSRLSASNAVALSAWKHVVVTWTGSATATNVKFYVDGVEMSYSTTTNASGTRASDSSSMLYIGNESGGTRAFDGLLDDVRIYNRVLSAAEIAAIHRAGL